ncbi:hypothetical protein DNU06_02410 [Putridiphycobacter roseus]|uniref:TonB C-terminal domain-containing protein n=1 Tax=Putridiphycobacter roseus TaxID=2219161 RepID=A0A2W1N6E4_9FLAO|nr:energy transducer TonB [Putridiphycobacter roseus]PZE18701.1 hypothetical protein DNU06_02410 [Putridiphycobacter roseus]
MKKPLLTWLIFLSSFASTAQNAFETSLEKYLDSLFIANEVDFMASKDDFFAYSKSNYKKVTSIKDFAIYAEHKIKTKEKSFEKEDLKSYKKFYYLGIVAKNNSEALENKLYDLVQQYNLWDSINIVTKAYFTLHELNYWGYNTYKPHKIGCTVKNLYAYTQANNMMDKLALFLLADKICKANYFVNPSYTCESKCAKLAVKMDMDSRNAYPVDSTDIFEPAQFINGNDALNSYINKNLFYPEKAFGQNGIVYISFVITEIGEVTNVQVVKSPSEFLSKESIRLVQSFPKWKPAQKNGQSTPMKMTLPIQFKL